MSKENDTQGDIVSDKYYFSSSSEIDSLFAGRFSENVREMEKKLEVSVTARDLWLKISSLRRENVPVRSSFRKSWKNFCGVQKKY